MEHLTKWSRAGPYGLLGMESFLSPISYRQDSSFHDLWVPKGRTVANQGTSIHESSFSSVQFSLVQLFATPWTEEQQASLPITNSWSLLKLMSIKSVISSNYLILCRPLLPLPSIFPGIRVFSNESVLCIRWPNYWSFIFLPIRNGSK